jgi:hypothetical protein
MSFDEVDMRMNRDAGGLAMSSSLGLRQWETAVVVLGKLLVVGGSAIVVAPAPFLGLGRLTDKSYCVDRMRS